MNATPTVRLTPAAHALIFTVLALVTTVIAYMMNQPFLYLAGLPTTMVGILITGDLMLRRRQVRSV